MRKTRKVINLDNGAEYIFTNVTPIEALQSMIYAINITEKCNSIINKTETNKHLYFEHNGETYATRLK